MSSTLRRGVGLSVRIPTTSFTSRSSTEAVISLHGSSHNCSAKRCATRSGRCAEMAESSHPAARMIVCHFIVSDDVERSARFYTEVLGGKGVFGPTPTNIELANTYIIINGGGGPTDDKPTVTLETPRDPDRVSSFLNIRVTDIHAVYDEW